MNEVILPPMPRGDVYVRGSQIGQPMWAFSEIQLRNFARAAVLADREARAEPVAWMWQHDETGSTGFVDCWQVQNGWQANNPRLKLLHPVYLAPQPVEQRKPLTDGQIAQISIDCALVTPDDVYFARAIEKAHGIVNAKESGE